MTRSDRRCCDLLMAMHLVDPADSRRNVRYSVFLISLADSLDSLSCKDSRPTQRTMLDALFYLFAFLLVSFSSATSGTVTVLQPLDEQLPLIARVNNSFSWSFSPTTFNPSDGSLKYTTSTLPTWLSFDGAARTFSGTPAPSDEGFPEITVTAHGHDSSTSSKFFLCVSSVAAPTMKKSIHDQFTPDNPSMSSVFYPRPGSVLSSSTVPAVRIPRKWSFSLGFDGKMFYGPNDNLAYDLRFANGSALSDFLVWNAKTVTLDGVIPPPERMPQPTRLSLVLSVTDQEGYSAARLPFEIVVADHELSQTGGPAPTLNVTATAPFTVNLFMALNLSTILVDDQPIQPANISSLELDVFQAQDRIQARYDNNTKVLSGTPPNDAAGMTTTFPVSISTTFGQTLQTNFTLALIPSFFAFSDIPSIHIKRGEDLRFNLAHWFAHPDESPTNVNISLTYDPPKAANWVHYDPPTTNLTGSFPLEYDDETDHVSVLFTATSLTTGAISKTTLYIYIAGTGQTNLTHPSGLSTESRKRLVLALAVTFSILGGICLLTGIFAMIQRWARMEDTAVMGEEGRHAWSEKDRQWYGMMLSPNGTRVIEKPPTSNSPTSSFPQPRRSGSRPNFGSLGMGLRRALERSRSDLHSSSNAQSSGVMSKKDFVARLRETMRQASDKYIARTSPPRPTIGKPILIHPHGDGGVGPAVSYPSTLSPQQGGIDSRPGSTFTSGSPSGSAGEHSIPRRRADFAPPRGLAQVHFADNGELMRQVSSVSIGCVIFSSMLCRDC